jgi:hypothetical protein
MTRKEATNFIKKMKKEYGKDYKKELARRTGCNPDNYDDYGLVYCMQFNTMSRKYAAERARAMKGHGEDLFKDDNGKKKKDVKEGYFRNLVKRATRSVINEAGLGFTPNPSEYNDSMFYSHDMPIETDASPEKLERLVNTYKRAVDELMASIHDIEYTGIENFTDYYDTLLNNGWNDFANDKI